MCELEKDKSYSYIFLTLTIRNCLADALSNNIDVLNNGFKQLTRKKQYKSVIQGHFKALEITHNKTDNSYHPHLHCILVVTQSYFKPQNYIKKDDWIVLWQKSVKADYKPSIDVQKIHQTTSKRITSAVAEVTKYTVKQTEYISDNNTYTDYLVSVYDGVLAHRRLVSFGGVMKDLHKKLNLSDVEQDLVHTDNTDEPLRSDVVDVIVRYRWGIGASGYNYYLVCDDM
jgi:plasmid rolling circle replication initiator protein Rep